MATQESVVNDLLASLDKSTDSPAYLVNPSPTLTRAWIKTTFEDNSPPLTRLLFSEQSFKLVRDDFLTASRITDLAENDAVSLRVSEDLTNQLLVTNEAVWTILSAGDQSTAMSTDNADFVGETYEHYSAIWDDAESVSMRTPPLSTVRASLQETFSPAMEADFMEMLTTSTAPDDNDGLDAVEIGVLVAAKHEHLLYDISKWGEDTGVASKATFSRVKTRLEEAGIIETEKVPIEVGRPRLRLFLAENALRDAPTTELTWTVEERLHTAAATSD